MMPLNQQEPVVIVSADSHVGPRLREDLRDYCPREHLDDYDRLIEQTGPIVNGQALLHHPNSGPGHYDPAARLADMDSDGVAAEVIYHGSQNGEPLPWGGSATFGIGTFDTSGTSQVELTELGCDIYDRWLADFCSADPKRLLGLVHIPGWDIAKSVETVKRAAAAGLTGVNFPVCGRTGIKAYNDPAWDPFWAACVEHGITLHTHGNGAPVFGEVTGPGAEEITITDQASWTSRRAAHYLIYGQVFDRFPELTLVITEIEEQWYQTTQWALDSQYRRFGHTPLAKGLPSAYFRSNIYMGASFMSVEQATEASRAGYADNVIWGRDYPHMEGAHQAGDFDEPVHVTALRNVMSRVPQQDAVKMAGLNGVRAMGLDGEYLAGVAARIGAPTLERLTTPVDTFPKILPLSMAFAGQSGPRPVEKEELENFRLAAPTWGA
jgi:predicted TIM-barrel fold metal-dependent hydrolase